MKRYVQGKWYLTPALVLLIAGLAAGAYFLPAPEPATADDTLPGTTPTAITVRLVEVRTAQLAPIVEAVEIPAVVVPETTVPQPETTTLELVPPAPAVEVPVVINLIETPEVTYHLEPLQAQQPRLALMY